jgi:hypothetical protein
MGNDKTVLRIPESRGVSVLRDEVFTGRSPTTREFRPAALSGASVTQKGVLNELSHPPL